MQERVQKILARNGVASRRKAEEWIAAGRVTVNGKVCSLGDTADEETDLIRVDGAPVASCPEKVYIMLNKPRGYVTTLSDEKGRRTVADLVDCGTRVYPVGRLDLNSEGLLLLTNDGTLANQLIHPSHEVEKTYLVWLRDADPVKLEAMGKSMTLDGYEIAPARVEIKTCSDGLARISLTIHEGRNRQIRKMAEMCQMRVTRLLRICEGTLSLGTLPSGQWRHLTKNELDSLLKM